MDSTELGIDFLAMCSMISLETTSLSTSVKVLSCRLCENISIAYTRYSSLVLTYLCVSVTTSHVSIIGPTGQNECCVFYREMRGDMHILFHQSMISFRYDLPVSL